ncbi:oligoribonuclease [Cellulomonas shaoxiangyii]|uniref:Oligoribonuclease n=1 Tax=Cellulomonas shaoxiangyii TaxID=2566013 RepID=A0A4P7SIL0_9CELL|nr:oligoribonuclease [Cellulomonas shaoxiangyii]QCB94079.1 oligoribonuclease [Cellulomonas shaoxiangyii]TGY83759.1 oligoribonuclease [Cellulomonas shaoxiangyii]
MSTAGTSPSSDRADTASPTAPAPAGSQSSNDRIVWVDCEMTGLDLEHDALVEVAAVVTDSELRVLGDGVDVVIAPPPAALEQMGEFVRSMHTTSGLLPALEHGVTLEEAQEQVLAYVRQWVPEPGKAPLAGNSVGTDKTFLDRDMPELVGHLHYRVVDVSSIKELARRWYPRVYFAAPEKNGGHRALADILESIDELRYYRAALMPAGAGPDSATARRAAAEVVATSVKRGVLAE